MSEMSITSSVLRPVSFCVVDVVSFPRNIFSIAPDITPICSLINFLPSSPDDSKSFEYVSDNSDSSSGVIVISMGVDIVVFGVEDVDFGFVFVVVVVFGTEKIL